MIQARGGSEHKSFPKQTFFKIIQKTKLQTSIIKQSTQLKTSKSHSLHPDPLLPYSLTPFLPIPTIQKFQT